MEWNMEYGMEWNGINFRVLVSPPYTVFFVSTQVAFQRKHEYLISNSSSPFLKGKISTKTCWLFVPKASKGLIQILKKAI